MDKLLCYDTCIITIEDYLFLVNVIGFNTVNALMDEGAIEIFNNKGAKAALTSLAENESLILNLAFDEIMDPEVKISEYQRIYNTSLDSKVTYKMSRTLRNVRQIDFDERWMRTLNEETSSDLNNQKITGKLGLINDGKIIDKNHDYNQFLLNRIAYLNLYMAFGNALSLKNILLPIEIQVLLNVKLGAYVNCDKSEQYNAYASITEYAGITDISKLLIDGIMNFSDVIKIRKNKHSVNFRKWLETLSKSGSMILSSEVSDYVQLYNTAVKEGVQFENINDSVITKALKFAIPAGIGAIPDPKALVLSMLIGSSLFVKDLIGNKFKPNVFIEDCLRKEIGAKMNESMLRAENTYYVDTYGKIPPNSKCPCRSGIKYKKCHGLFK